MSATPAWLMAACLMAASCVLCASPSTAAPLSAPEAITAQALPTAQEPGTAPVPAMVATLAGCWQGSGEVMGKPVSITLTASPVALGAMLAIDTYSAAMTDPADRYSAHLVIGGSDPDGSTRASGTIAGYWSDSFGGAHAAAGSGKADSDGFEITYDYGKHQFVNRWRIAGDRADWRIVAKAANDGQEAPFASYTLARRSCKN